MFLSVLGYGSLQEVRGITTIPVRLRCHACRHIGVFEPFFPNDIFFQSPNGCYFAGQRCCPNPECRAHVFFVSSPGDGDKVVASYPPERIDFDSTDIPQSVVNSLEEAIACHASQCFIAAAIMVRKTLEELCRDQGAQGSNLRQRIRDLGTKVILPKELLGALDELRLLGNDAAHVESQAYEKVGKEEVEIGIEFAKEVLKAVYQYSTLLSRLQGLKKASNSQATGSP